VPRKLEAVREFGKLPESRASRPPTSASRTSCARRTRRARRFPTGTTFAEKLESDLTRAAARLGGRGPLFEKGDYTGYLKSFAVLRQPVDAFFDGIMVMCEDPASAAGACRCSTCCVRDEPRGRHRASCA
jgi:glycyl-tRNA synthetase beta chain